MDNQDALLTAATFERLSALAVVELEFDVGSTLRIHMRSPDSTGGQTDERGMIWVGCAEWVMISRTFDMLDSDTVSLSGTRVSISSKPTLRFHFGPSTKEKSFLLFCGDEFTLYVWSEDGKYEPTDVLIMFSHSHLPIVSILNDGSISRSSESGGTPVGVVH